LVFCGKISEFDEKSWPQSTNAIRRCRTTLPDGMDGGPGFFTKGETFALLGNPIGAALRRPWGERLCDLGTSGAAQPVFTNLDRLGASNGRREAWCHLPAKDVDVFERVYRNEHVPPAVAGLGAKTKMAATKVLGSPQGLPPFYRIAEVHFPSIETLEACPGSDGGKETLAHAVKISTGGKPIFLVAEEETFTFSQTANA
jgi:uncharacterized protein (TIGR02118 family)